jgi:hypothetical protein
MALTMYSRSSTTPHIVHRMSMQQNTLEWEWVTWKCPITAFMLRLVQTVKEFERNTKVVESQKRSALKETGSSKFWGPRTVYSLVQFSQKSQHIISYLSNKPNSWGRSIIAKYVQFPVSSKYTFILHHFFFRKQPNPTKLKSVVTILQTGRVRPPMRAVGLRNDATSAFTHPYT